MATIKDVAKEAGVSIATVSRVINHSPKASEASINAVTSAMKKLGYRPNAAAKALVSQSSNTVGVLVGDVSDPFFGTLVKAVDKVAHQHGKHILVGNGYHDAEMEKKSIELLINNRCDALIIHSKALSDQQLIAYANEVKGMVLINRHIDDIAERCISLDNHRGAYLATEFLIRQGHKAIGYLSSSHGIEDCQARLQGYQQALSDHQLEFHPSYVESNEPNSDGGEQAMTNLLAKALPISAIVAYNDHMAAGALSVLDENAIAVPEQMSIVGFDDGLIARYVKPRLTTIRYPIELMATKATELALSQNTAADQAQTLTFQPTVVKRNSVSRLA